MNPFRSQAPWVLLSRLSLDPKDSKDSIDPKDLLCLWERVIGMPSFDIGVGHGSAYRLVEENIARYVVKAYRGRPERALTAGSIVRHIILELGVSGFSLQPEHIVRWVSVFEERTGRQVLEAEPETFPVRYRCVYHKDIRIL